MTGSAFTLKKSGGFFCLNKLRGKPIRFDRGWVCLTPIV
jgi:hypothetical protein